MKKQFVIIIVCLLGCVQVSQAQHKLSLKDAEEYAARNRYDAQANKLDVNLAENAISKSRNEWIPELSANGEILYNTQLQTIIFGNGEALKMGTQNLTTLSLNLSQPIFKPGLSTDIKINKAALSAQKEASRKKESDIKIYVSEAYLNVILRQQQLELSIENTERYKSYCKLAQDKKQLGAILESDLLQSRTDYENSSISLQKAEQNYTLAIKALKYHLNMPDSEEVVLIDSLSVLLSKNPIQKWIINTEDRPELKQIYYSQQENNLRLKKNVIMWLPTISFIANYTIQYQADDYMFSQKFWFPYNYIGLKTSIPLSNIFKLSTNRKEYKVKSSQLAMQYNQKLHDINYEMDKCNTELLNASGNISLTIKTLNLSKKLYAQQLAVYKLGTITYRTLLDAESSVDTAEQNYLKSVYDYLIAFYSYNVMYL